MNDEPEGNAPLSVALRSPDSRPQPTAEEMRMGILALGAIGFGVIMAIGSVRAWGWTWSILGFLVLGPIAIWIISMTGGALLSRWVGMLTLKKDPSRKVGWAIPVVLLMDVIALMAIIQMSPAEIAASASATAAPTDAPATPAPWPPAVGHKYVLGDASGKAACLESKADFDAMEEAASKNDQFGFDQATMSARMIPTGTTVLVLDYNVFNGQMRMRVLDGDDAGTACWIEAGSDDHGFFKKALDD